ncbi:ABC transporter ATP-binding protein/permease [Haloplasma contractile]|uniref:Lipoprotein-releasing system ATP-binding protein n=1 Tax=Haloplasma contractile SSD-17B TaxID=1033810 RepID=F7PVY7_9MOLU|nr:ABC transporter ATP-binding protein/permease [Haloplasma contractile]ERJ12689.1 lipoprotein-releasing system ATP-binding protein [Haloplasma contractile SSD-17B]
MIKLVNIHKIFENGNTGFLALKDVNIDFTENEFVCVLGKSGSGKTTLLNIIGGLDTPSSGHMVVDGVLTTKFTETQWDHFRNHKIGFIFQNFSLIEHLTVLDNVIIASKLQGVDKKEVSVKALEILRKVKIEDQANKLPKQLSGGQRQRVSVARALINDPDIILADEPTGALDKKTSKEVLDLIKEISKNKLIVMVTHSKRLANQYADRVINIKDGEVIDDTRPRTNEKVKIVKHNPKRTKFKLWDKVKHALGNIKMKKWRSFLTAFGLAIGVSGFILIDGISNGVRVNVDKQLDAYNNQPHLIYHVTEDNLEGKDLETYIDDLTDDEAIHAVRYDNGRRIRLMRINETEIDPNRNYSGYKFTYKFTDDESEQLRYFGKVYDDGRWPDADNEIVLSYNFALSLYDIDNIKTLWERLDNAEIEVVTESYYSVPYDFVYSFIDGGTEGYYKERFDVDDLACKTYNLSDETVEPEGYDAETFGAFNDQINTQKSFFNKVIYDERSSGEKQVVFCNDYTPFLIDPSAGVKDSKTYTVVGINKSQNISHSIVTEEAYKRMPITKGMRYDERGESYSYYPIEIYLTDDAKEQLFDIQLKYRDEVKHIEEVYSYSESTMPIMDVAIGIIQFIISLIMSVSVLTAGLMLLLVLFISVLERSREIGILRSLGATKSDILSIFVVESGVIGFLAGIIGVVLAIVLTVGANLFINHRYREDIEQIFNETDVNIIILRPVASVIAIIICILFAMIFGLIPAISASRKTPIDALRRVK